MVCLFVRVRSLSDKLSLASEVFPRGGRAGDLQRGEGFEAAVAESFPVQSQ